MAQEEQKPQEEKELEEWIVRARNGKTISRRVQCYLNDSDYEWFLNFRNERGLKESPALRLCLRHIMVEHGMKERGRNSSVAKHEVDVDSLLNLRGTHETGED